MQKLTKKELEKLTKEQAFNYAKKLGFKKVPSIVVEKIYYMETLLLLYATELNFKNVPKLVIDILSRHSMACRRYIEESGYKNIPKKMIYKLSQDEGSAYWYAEKMNFKNIPKIITDKLAMSPYYAWEYTKNILINKKLPFTEIDSVKLPQNILNTVKNSGLYNKDVLRKGNMFRFNFKYESGGENEPGKYNKVNVNKCPDELNKEIMEEVFEEENPPHVWFNQSAFLDNLIPFDFTVNNKKYLCIFECMKEYASMMDIVITEYTEPKIQSFSKEIIYDRLRFTHLKVMFFLHCAKIITDNKSARTSHWIKELWQYCGWIQYNRIKHNNKPISYNLMRECFFGGMFHNNYNFFKKDLYWAYTEIKKVKPEIQDKSNDRLVFVRFKMFLRKTMQLLSKQQLTEEKITVLAKQYLI